MPLTTAGEEVMLEPVEKRHSSPGVAAGPVAFAVPACAYPFRNVDQGCAVLSAFTNWLFDRKLGDCKTIKVKAKTVKKTMTRFCPIPLNQPFTQVPFLQAPSFFKACWESCIKIFQKTICFKNAD